MRRRKRLTPLAATMLAALLAGPVIAGLVIDDLEKLERNATSFVDLAPNAQVPPGTLPGAKFGSPGAVRFIQNPDFYLDGSNRSWGFRGPGRATIGFGRVAASVTIAARGSAKGDTAGPGFGFHELVPAVGLVHAIGPDGRRVASRKLENLSLRGDGAKPITFANLGPITAIVLENRATSKSSLVVIGGIGHTPRCPRDVNGDGKVDLDDALDVMMAIGTKDPAADVNGDRSVDAGDVIDILSDTGTCG